MKKLLFIRYKKSRSILEGGEQSSHNHVSLFGKILGEENITQFYIHDETQKRSMWDYLCGVWGLFANRFFGLTNKKIAEILKIADNFDIVFVDRSVFGIIAKRLKQANYQGKIISFFHNVEKIYFAAKISRFAPWRPLVLHCANRNDKYACQFSDTIIALNERDAREIEKRYHRRTDLFLPVAFKDKKTEVINQKSEMTENPLRCLFLGAYFPANTEGILWFISEVYPNVNIQLKIVGKGMAQLKKDITLPAKIELISDAPDLKPFFEEADIMVLPIFKGSGMKVKTAESLMYGKNIIGTSEAFEGYELDYEKVGARCETKEMFIVAINDFSKNPRPKFNEYARKIFLEKYSEEAVFEKMKNLLN